MEGAAEIKSFVQRWQALLVAGGVAVIAAALIVGYFLWFRQPYAVLFRDLRTADAATIVADLAERKVPYRLGDGGRSILVPEKLVDGTRLAVMSSELPLKGVVGFELFSKSDMGLTEFAQQINYRRALQGEIARTIMALDSVESARVHLSISERTVFRDERRPSKASVTLVPRRGRQLTGATVAGVQRLVAAAVPDLLASDVVILDERGALISATAPAPAPAAPPAVQEKAAVEAYYAGRVRHALMSLLPEDQVVVAVEAGWDPASVADPGADPFAGWSPATRAFPLTVAVTTAIPVGPAVRDQIQALAAEAVASRAAAGDSVTVTYAAPAAPVAALPAAEPAPPPVAPSHAAAPAPAEVPAPTAFWIAVSVPTLALLLFLAAALHRRGVRPRRLTLRERDALAARLRVALEKREADALVRS